MARFAGLGTQASAAEVFGGVGLGTARLARIVERRRLEGHQIRRLELGPAFGQRMLDRLVLADGAAEHLALLGVVDGAAEREAADADRLGGDQDALRVEAVQDVAKAGALLADQIVPGTLSASMNSMFESTALRPIFSISRTSMRSRSRSV